MKLQEVFIERQNKCLYLVFDYAEYDLFVRFVFIEQSRGPIFQEVHVD